MVIIKFLTVDEMGIDQNGSRPSGKLPYLHRINNIKTHNTILLNHWISEIIIKKNNF